jgi:hypothetical protein
MATYLRNLFGGSSQSTPAHGKARTRSRTESTPGPSPPFYVYTSPTTSSTSTSGTSRTKVQRQRTNSYNTPSMVSSPLRYPTYDSRHSHEDSRPSPNRAGNTKPPPEMNGPYNSYPLPISGPSRTHIRSAETAGRVTQLPPSGYVTPGSSRSNSSSSLYPGPVFGFVPSPLVPSPPRSQTSDDAPAKPASQKKIAWQVGASSSASGSSTCTSYSYPNLSELASH